MSMLDDVRFWDQVVQDAKRTLLVPPDLESQAVEMAKAHGVAHLVTVRASPHLPDNTVYLVDEQALEANLRQAVHRRPTL